METSSPFAALAVSLGLGLLVGLQREHSGSRLAGVRTFPLITLLGTVLALLARGMEGGTWIVAAGLIAVGAATGMGNFLAWKQDGARDTGITTEVAVLVMYGLGAYAAVGAPSVVLAVGVAVAVLLYAKGPMHGLVARIGDRDMRAMMLLAAITFVVLPVLPDAAYGPMGVWNPRDIWLMVVLVVGMSVGGYVAYKALGARGGAVVAGLLGGLISSTATTVTFARRAREKRAYVMPGLLVIMLASGVVYVRLLVEIAVVSPAFLEAAWAPLAVMLALSLGLAGAAWVMAGRAGDGLPEPENPTQLRSALMFAGLYAAVLLAVAAGKRYLGDGGVFAVAGVSGLTDMDAITLSTARLVAAGGMEPGAGWRAILVAAVSNMAFKAAVVGVMAGGALLARVGAMFAVKAAVAVGLILLWP